MNAASFLPIAEGILSQPTAPFHEHAVRAEILRRLAKIPNVSSSVDEFGNVIARYQGGGQESNLLLCAHMDHPAYVGAEFRGGVPKAFLDQNPPLKDYGQFSMWDLPAIIVEDGIIHSRACDDLIGCSVIVAALEALAERQVPTTVDVAFTCAEEVGLLGAAYLARSGRIPKTTLILSLETSSERPPAKMHDGVIIRVGDKTSVFDSGLVASLCSVASQHGIRFQRCLMAGGTCEATAFQVYGYRAAGICVALGNYHNCGPNNSIAAEYVSVEDALGMARLCVAAASVDMAESNENRLRTRLDQDLAVALSKMQIVDFEAQKN